MLIHINTVVDSWNPSPFLTSPILQPGFLHDPYGLGTHPLPKIQGTCLHQSILLNGGFHGNTSWLDEVIIILARRDGWGWMDPGRLRLGWVGWGSKWVICDSIKPPMFTSHIQQQFQAETFQPKPIATCLALFPPVAPPCKCQTPKCHHPSRGLAHRPTRPHGTWDPGDLRGIPPGHRTTGGATFKVKPFEGRGICEEYVLLLLSVSNPFMIISNINTNIAGIYCTSFRQHGTTQKTKHFSNLRGRCYLSWGRVIRSVRQSVLSQWASCPFLPSFIHVSLVFIAKSSLSKDSIGTTSTNQKLWAILNGSISPMIPPTTSNYFKLYTKVFHQKAPSFRVP